MTRQSLESGTKPEKIAALSLAMTTLLIFRHCEDYIYPRHCEERSDAAISIIKHLTRKDYPAFSLDDAIIFRKISKATDMIKLNLTFP